MISENKQQKSTQKQEGNDSACKCGKWQRRKEDRPGEILFAALQVFSSKGFAAARLDEVAKKAGVSKGTLYLYFESKQALFKAVVTEFVLPQIQQAEEHAESYQGPIRDLMMNLLQHWQTHVLQTELAGIPKMIIAEASNFPELAEFYVENVVNRVLAFISKLIQLGIDRNEFRHCDPVNTARAFLTPMVFSAIWQHSMSVFDKGFDTKDYLDTHIEIILDGLTKDNQA